VCHTSEQSLSIARVSPDATADHLPRDARRTPHLSRRQGRDANELLTNCKLRPNHRQGPFGNTRYQFAVVIARTIDTHSNFGPGAAIARKRTYAFRLAHL
jgi:hypothetical protein